MTTVILAHDKFGPVSAKTGASLIRYGRDKVVAVIDRSKAGHDAGEFLDVAKGIPIVASMREALAFKPDTLAIGIAPVGGMLPDEWRVDLETALQNGVDVVSGLHFFIADDPALAGLSARTGAKIVDVRRPPQRRLIATGEARRIPAITVLTIGTDCSIGKMTTAVELQREALRRGIEAAFVATGQTGMMIGADEGVAIDAVVGDFMAGEVERMVLSAAGKGKRLIVVEGQGTTSHPAYSGVTVSLLHGASPDYLILCHDATRKHKKSFEDFPIVPLKEEIENNERLLRHTTGGRVVGVALMTLGLTDEQARAEVAKAERESGLPATDPVRFGPGILMDAIEKASYGHRKRVTLRGH
ncbi:MAG: DUF1611 domain-containing protein [Euryarchaeota archaeon]|nr:DUF1611 domain-containing protein [Euryarchaeota archaeon]